MIFTLRNVSRIRRIVMIRTIRLIRPFRDRLLILINLLQLLNQQLLMDLFFHRQQHILIEIEVQILGVLAKVHYLVISHLHDFFNNMAYLDSDHLQVNLL